MPEEAVPHTELSATGEGLDGVLPAVCRNPPGGALRQTTALTATAEETAKTQTGPSPGRRCLGMGKIPC